jgi:tRNA nucleotidyltransferase/poly(A) polymerase
VDWTEALKMQHLKEDIIRPIEDIAKSYIEDTLYMLRVQHIKK